MMGRYFYFNVVFKLSLSIGKDLSNLYFAEGRGDFKRLKWSYNHVKFPKYMSALCLVFVEKMYKSNTFFIFMITNN